MRIPRFALAVALLLAALLASGCILVPQMKDRVVQLATGGSVVVTLHAQGSVNTFDGTNTIHVLDSLNVARILHDAGIDPSRVDTITVAGVQYRVSRADPTAGRTITNGVVQIAVSGGALTALIDDFSGAADHTTGWITPTLDPAGVAKLDQLLAAILANAKYGTPVNDLLTYDVSGNSAPTSVNTDFLYDIKLTINIVGTVKTKVLD